MLGLSAPSSHILAPLFLVLFFLAWASEIPVAPAPREKTCSNKLITGTWNFLEIDGEKVPKEWEMTAEFQETGQFFISFNDGRSPYARVSSGKYTITNSHINFDRNASPAHAASKWSVSIVQLGTEELTIRANGQVSRLKKQPPRKP